MGGTWQDKKKERLWNGFGLIEGWHLRSWICTIGSVSFFVLLVLNLEGIWELDEGGWGIALIGMMAVFVFIYPWEVWAANSYRYLKQIHTKGNVTRIVNRIKRSKPSVNWHVQCYHYEERRTEDTTERVRVNTWSATQCFKFDSWFDDSAPLTGMDQFQLTKLKLEKKFVFDNRKTAAEFRRQKDSFKASNRKDTHQEFSQDLIVPSFESNILSEAYKGARPCCLNRAFYLLFHLVCLGPCYRTWFSGICGKKRHDIIKVMSCN